MRPLPMMIGFGKNTWTVASIFFIRTVQVPGVDLVPALSAMSRALGIMLSHVAYLETGVHQSVRSVGPIELCRQYMTGDLLPSSWITFRLYCRYNHSE